jgi:hypothetical protein
MWLYRPVEAIEKLLADRALKAGLSEYLDATEGGAGAPQEKYRRRTRPARTFSPNGSRTFDLPTTSGGNQQFCLGGWKLSTLAVHPLARYFRLETARASLWWQYFPYRLEEGKNIRASGHR